MTNQTKAKLLIGKATDAQLAEADKTIDRLAKDFVAAKPWAKKRWDQATNARFIGYALGLETLDEKSPDVPAALADSEFASMDAVQRAAFLLAVGNASQMRQRLAEAGIIEAEAELGEYK